jgi:hypothetical protein
MSTKMNFVKISAVIFCVYMNQPWGDMDFDPVVKPSGITVKKAVKKKSKHEKRKMEDYKNRVVVGSPQK